MRRPSSETVLATFMLTEPVPVAVAFVAVSAAAAYARVMRPARSGPVAVDVRTKGDGDAALSLTSRGPAWPQWAHVGIVIGVTLAAAALAAMLGTAGTPAAHALLLFLGVVAAFVLSVELYRRRRSRLTFESAALCILARVGVWLLILLMIGRPRWEWVVVEWEEPLLMVLLDQSESMSITDPDRPEQSSRATLVNQAIAEARPWIKRLEGRYEVRTLGVGESAAPLEHWQVQPRAPASAIAAALRRAGQLRSVHGEAPVGVVLVSDGAENVLNPRAVRDAASELAGQQTAVLAVGVGPDVDSTPAILLEPLVVPRRIGSRDRMRVPVAASVTGCAGQAIRMAALWGDEQVDQRRVPIERPTQRAAAEFELRPPGVGLHRLTVRATLPAELGAESFETSAVVDVSDDRIRVLVLAGRPRSEMGFATRALSSEPRFDVVQRLLLGGPSQARGDTAPIWSDYDVVVFGDVPGKRLGFDSLRELADAVRERGVGLLMVGGRDFYHEGYYSRSELSEVSPVAFTLGRPPDDYHPRFQPTELGRRHPILLGIGARDGAPRGASRQSAIWDELPPLGGAASFGRPKPLAAILATDSDGRPLLATLDVGRGRTAAAAWDSTWPWALSSGEGLAAHGALWRQMVGWLANRRPVAWVVTDRSSYVRAALAGGRHTLQIRAGLSGVETPPERTRLTEYRATLELRLLRTTDVATAEPQADQPTSGPTSSPSGALTDKFWSIPLKRRGTEWRAELPRDLRTQAWLTSGEYELVFVVEQAASVEVAAQSAPDQRSGTESVALSARTGFTIFSADLELLEPTANLALLRDAATRTEEVGGAYYAVDELPAAVRRLAEDDRRRRIERQGEYDLIGRQPWPLLVLVTAALGLEWIVRKRGGMP